LTSSSKNFNESLLIKRSKPSLKLTKALINSKTDVWKVEEYLNDFMKDCVYKDDFYKLMYFNFKYDLPNGYLVKVDRMSMAYSLETRLPFLDYRLIEFMCRVNKKIKMNGNELKSVLRKTIGETLPSKLLSSPKKGFRVPVRDWIKSDKQSSFWYDSIIQSSFFNHQILSKIITDNNYSKSDNGALLWSIIMLDSFTHK